MKDVDVFLFPRQEGSFTNVKFCEIKFLDHHIISALSHSLVCVMSVVEES